MGIVTVTYRSIFAAIASLVMVMGCTNDTAYHPPAGQKVRITQATYDHFKYYQQLIGSTHPGAFAVSQSGSYSWHYYCKEITCMSGISWGHEAVKDCEREANEPCYVFAYDNDIKVDYEVMQ